jgi:hypothetical protein
MKSGSPPYLHYGNSSKTDARRPWEQHNMDTVRRFNEGKACDAVIRCIEKREGHPRSKIGFPERVHHPAPVEITCQIGDQLFAFEHTGIEPFEQHTELQAKAQTHFRPIQDLLVDVLPADGHFELSVPIRATLHLRPRELRQMQDAVIEWVKQTAPTLPIPRGGRQISQVRFTPLPNTPFEAVLARVPVGALGQLSIGHLVGDHLEVDRISRIRRAYKDKSEKLAAWQRSGARSVLILEQNDIFVTNEGLVADALQEIESTIEMRPNEIYLLSSAIDAFWSLWSLRIDDRVFDDLSYWGDALTTDIDPMTLNDLTKR